MSQTIPGLPPPSIAAGQNTPYQPQPHPYGAMHTGDVDNRYETFVPMFEAVQLNDTIVGTPTIAISRVDGASMGANDLQVKPNSITVDPVTEQIVYFWLQNALTANVQYWIEVTVQTQEGRTLTRTGYLAVLPRVG